MLIENAAFEPNNQKSIVKPYMLTHGTMECHNLKETRKFLEECLGMEVVRHAPPGMVMRCGLKFNIVCLETGNVVRTTTIEKDRKRVGVGKRVSVRVEYGRAR